MEEFQKVVVNRVTGKPLRLCTNCGDAMIAAKSSKYVSERCVRNSWSCDVCGFEVETTATFNFEENPRFICRAPPNSARRVNPSARETFTKFNAEQFFHRSLASLEL